MKNKTVGIFFSWRLEKVRGEKYNLGGTLLISESAYKNYWSLNYVSLVGGGIVFFISLCIKHYCFNPILISYFFANHQQTMRPVYVNQMKMQIFFFLFYLQTD